MIGRGCTNLVGCLLVLVVMGALLLVAGPTLASHVPKDIALLKRDIPKDITSVKASIKELENGFRADGRSTPKAKWVRPTAANCAWGEAALRDDANLDLDGAENYPQWNSYYQMTSSWWLTALGQVRGLCGAGTEPTAAACYVSVAHFELAYTDHSQDEENNPENQAWDQQWMANYTQLEQIFIASGCGA